MSSQEKSKSISEILSESCPKKEQHAEFLDRPCPECGHINAVPGSTEHRDAIFRGIRERIEKEGDPQIPDDK